MGKSELTFKQYESALEKYHAGIPLYQIQKTTGVRIRSIYYYLKHPRKQAFIPEISLKRPDRCNASIGCSTNCRRIFNDECQYRTFGGIYGTSNSPDRPA